MEEHADDDDDMMEMMEYDGGMVAMGDDMAGMDIVVVDVPKLIGIGYFGATTLGQQQAAEELGNVSASPLMGRPTPISTTRSKSSTATSRRA